MATEPATEPAANVQLQPDDVAKIVKWCEENNNDRAIEEGSGAFHAHMANANKELKNLGMDNVFELLERLKQCQNDASNAAASGSEVTMAEAIQDITMIMHSALPALKSLDSAFNDQSRVVLASHKNMELVEMVREAVDAAAKAEEASDAETQTGNSEEPKQPEISI